MFRINELTIVKLHGKFDRNVVFNNDINILTGLNGAGKTTTLKILWFIISGNIEHLINEIEFNDIKLDTSNYFIEIERDVINEQNIIYKFSLLDKKTNSKILENKKEEHKRVLNSQTIDLCNRFCALQSASVFFPTFRRIEGGFGMTDRFHNSQIRERGIYQNVSIQDSLDDLSRRMSVFEHKFVSSISTYDIQLLLNKKQAELTNKMNSHSNELTSTVLDLINYTNQQTSSYVDNVVALEAANKTLADIKISVEKFKTKQQTSLKPFTILNELINKIFAHNGIRLSEDITFGSTADAIESAKLSSGEKQMLSFICYNAFLEKGILFIDEPELSLHFEWQRSLLDTLLEQQTNNQIFIATHSPFIYTEYSDKEIII